MASYDEIKQLTNQLRRLRGQPIRFRPRAVIELEEKIAKLRRQIEEMERKRYPEGEIAPLRGELAQLEFKLREELRKMA